MHGRGYGTAAKFRGCFDSEEAVVVGVNTVDDRRRNSASGRGNVDPRAAVIPDIRIGHVEIAGCGRHEFDAIGRKLANGAFLYMERLAGNEADAIDARAHAL